MHFVSCNSVRVNRCFITQYLHFVHCLRSTLIYFQVIFIPFFLPFWSQVHYTYSFG
uniref:Uncharacterized protein n=1 Tax=Arundo donax TaxID=35708 RepID=A0A0A9FJ54_ARUDO